MRAVVFTRFGGPEVLQVVDLPPPEPGPGEVRVRVIAAGVSPADVQLRRGWWMAWAPHDLPVIVGWDGAGIIEKSDTAALPVGMRVWFCVRRHQTGRGTWAEQLCLPAELVRPVPEGLLLHEAAAVPFAGLAAYQALFRPATVEPGMTVLIHAAAGGVGHLAVQMARHAGARVIATASSANQEFVQSLGAELVINHAVTDFREAISALAPGGVDVVLDPLGGDIQLRSLDVLSPIGTLVSLVQPPLLSMLQARRRCGRHLVVQPDGADLDQLRTWMERGVLRVHVSQVFPLQHADVALEVVQRGRTRGKMVVVL